MIQFISSSSNTSIDNFDSNIQNNKSADYQDSFSDVLNKTEKTFNQNKTDKTELNNNYDNDDVSKQADSPDKINNNDLDNNDEKQIKKTEENNEVKSNIEDKKYTEDKKTVVKDIDENDIKDTDKKKKKEKKIDIYNNIIDLVKLETGKEIENIDIKSLIEKIDEIIEHIKLSKKDKNSDVEINDILSLMQEIKISIENISNKAKSNNKADIKNDIDLIKEKLNNLLENSKTVDSKVLENTKAALNELDQLIKNESNIQTPILENSNINNNDSTKTSIEKVKPEGDKSETNFSKSTESISNEKGTEFIVVKSKDGVTDIMDKPLDNKLNMAKTSNPSPNSSIDIMNKFQDMLSKVVERAKLTLSEGKTDMILSLKPEHLGNVRMKMTMEGDNFYGKVFVDNAEVKDIFTKNIDTIISSLKELNINIEGFDIAFNQNRDSGQNFDDDDSNTFGIDGRTSDDASNANIEQTVTIATHLFPERKLNIVI